MSEPVTPLQQDPAVNVDAKAPTTKSAGPFDPVLLLVMHMFSQIYSEKGSKETREGGKACR